MNDPDSSLSAQLRPISQPSKTPNALKRKDG